LGARKVSGEREGIEWLENLEREREREREISCGRARGDDKQQRIFRLLLSANPTEENTCLWCRHTVVDLSSSTYQDTADFREACEK